ncbi:conserved hypothetical protein [Pediculus humanus corporis]|uniref:Nuclear receptor domain-containing protein n=1 Tax=Pediculus humanus subsp. corporis TaxID=121224 RepID=E0VVW9_PEDHC|nr:uncharacterized protein Phum_PHUM470190 [Pediculus humanus corporis]EEB17525.1 conserved hypothetical protein [Pediculus humanus corporis]
MNQQCKVCGEPAAGFHFGAFTCEGCKSFFGRSYNNLNSITECKNNGECIINKKNRTACKSCRLRKCLLVGMSKSGSRYGRRSNWFKIHCLLQEQQQAAVAQMKGKNPSTTNPLENPLPLLSPLAFPHPNLGSFLRPNNSSSPSDFYLPVPFHSMFMQPPPPMSSPFLLPPSLLPFPVPPTKHNDYSQRLSPPDHVQNVHKRNCLTPEYDEENTRTDSPPSRQSPTNNNNNNDYSSKCININDDNSDDNSFGKNKESDKEMMMTVRSKRFYLDAILGLKTSSEKKIESVNEKKINDDVINNDDDNDDEIEKLTIKRYDDEQDNPIDLSVKSSKFKKDFFTKENNRRKKHVEEEEEEEENVVEEKKKIFNNNNRDDVKPIPLDLTV